MHINETEAESLGFFDHGVGDVFIVKPPAAAARVTLQRTRIQSVHLIVKAIDRGLRLSNKAEPQAFFISSIILV